MISLGSKQALTMVYGALVTIRTSRDGLARLVEYWLERVDSSDQADYGIHGDLVGCFPADVVDFDAAEIEMVAVLGCEVMLASEDGLPKAELTDFRNDVYTRSAVDDAIEDLKKDIKRSRTSASRKSRRKHPLEGVDVVIEEKKPGYYLVARTDQVGTAWFGAFVDSKPAKLKKGLSVHPHGDRFLVGYPIGEIQGRLSKVFLSERGGETRIGNATDKKTISLYDASESIDSLLQGSGTNDQAFFVFGQGQGADGPLELDSEPSIELSSTALGVLLDGIAFERVDLDAKQAERLDVLMKKGGPGAMWVIAGDPIPEEPGPHQNVESVSLVVGRRLAESSADDGPVLVEPNDRGPLFADILTEVAALLGAPGEQGIWLAAVGPLASAHLVRGEKVSRDKARSMRSEGRASLVLGCDMHQEPHESAILGDVLASCRLGLSPVEDWGPGLQPGAQVWLVARYD